MSELDKSNKFLQQSVNFQKAVPVRTYQNITSQIEEAILSGELKPYDRLPSERELQKLFGVGRASIREAIRILESNGLVEVKSGAVNGGIFVKPLSTNTTVDSLQRLFLVEKISEKEMIEYRVSLEGVTAIWAANRATDEDIQKIDQIIKLMENEDNWKLFHDRDLEFHIAIAGAAKNHVSLIVMKAIRETLLRIMEEAFSNIMESSQIRNTIVEEHKQILEAIKQKDTEKARILLTEHIISFYKHVELL